MVPIMASDRELFDLWYAKPLELLEKMPNGQGGFVVLAIACFLYERYAKSLLKSQGKKANSENMKAQLARDFSVDEESANTFWDVIRDGILHQGMPIQKANNVNLPPWGFNASYPALLLDEINGQPFLKVEPFKFMHRVLELWEGNFDLLQANESFPWAAITRVPQ